MSADTIKGPPGRELTKADVVDWPVEPVLAICPHGDLVLVTPGDIGKPCWRDGKPLRKATKAEARRVAA